METNFEIEDNYAVRLNGVHIDLHNNFDFIELSKNDNDILIVFRKTEGNWVKNDEFELLNFEFKNISYEYYEEGDPKALKEDTERLGEITFFPEDSREINDGIILQAQPNKNDDLILFLDDGKLIRIACEEINLTTKKTNVQQQI